MIKRVSIIIAVILSILAAATYLYVNKSKNMNSTETKIIPGKLKENVWKEDSMQKISWTIENLPEGNYVVEIKLIDTSTNNVVGSIHNVTPDTKNGTYSMDYKPSTILIGGDAIQALNPGTYQLKFQILKLEVDDGTIDSYKPSYAPGYFFEVVAESLGEVVEVIM
jgi:hypothetical protein